MKNWGCENDELNYEDRIKDVENYFGWKGKPKGYKKEKPKKKRWWQVFSIKYWKNRKSGENVMGEIKINF
jgi:hypothetical protein